MLKTTTTSGISQPIVFFGTDSPSMIALEILVNAGVPISVVITKPDTAKGRGHKISAPAVKEYALAHNITVWQPTRLKDVAEDIKSLGNPVGILVSYGKIIPESIINLFKPGIINVHPSLLPMYRGPSPIESAIANRDKKTGVTIMQLSKGMDAGPVYNQAPYALDFTETKLELYTTLFTLGTNLLISMLPAIVSGEIQPTPQIDEDASYCSLLTKHDGDLDLSSITPGEAEARIRAHAGFPRSRITIGSHTVIVTKAHGVMTKETPLDLECSNGAFLAIDELIAPSGKTMSSSDFLRGYPL